MSGVENRLRGLSALVTGGAKGIGAGIVQRLAAEGARVVIFDIDRAAAEALGEARGGSTEAAVVDLTDQAAVAGEIARLGPFDIAVNNAGVDQHAFFTKTTPEDWTRLLAINLLSVFAVTHAVLPGMQAAGFGRIVNIGSEAGRVGSKGGSVYSAAKGGVIAFTKSIAIENARFGITANNVLPGPIDTPLLRAAVEKGGDSLMKAMEGATLLGRLGTPEEVAAAVAFLASREAGFVTGETLGVSGGMGISAG
ncbi:3-oxoacyl-[acyl-carrier-protein] reductase FabG (plasmid) [Sulfitobacter sp. THAF37]|uniref:SDR family NAD(P)-dependent oxidoreductase n=1 Tax=Sulfitobacter sp. THAF37 TaxID=2587855 RepID=UPI0012694966|nr:SDR family NAD(P)-dependent oxidoreductase [Sulfitobacter sp. THAF37]QFT61050.1 3-oxoacyl-[acyl-carrier-protein] reductase FabG [Sulfitobacter sp. THAF37]